MIIYNKLNAIACVSKYTQVKYRVMGTTNEGMEAAYRQMVDTARQDVEYALPRTADRIRISMARDEAGERVLSACIQMPCPNDTVVDIKTVLEMAEVVKVNWLPEPQKST